MSHMSKLEDQFDLKNWPHRFTKDGKDFSLGEDEDTHDKIISQPMICMDCNIKFVAGQSNRPPDPCPARSKKSEMKRLLS